MTRVMPMWWSRLVSMLFVFVFFIGDSIEEFSLFHILSTIVTWARLTDACLGFSYTEPDTNENWWILMHMDFEYFPELCDSLEIKRNSCPTRPQMYIWPHGLYWPIRCNFGRADNILVKLFTWLSLVSGNRTWLWWLHTAHWMCNACWYLNI